MAKRTKKSHQHARLQALEEGSCPSCLCQCAHCRYCSMSESPYMDQQSPKELKSRQSISRRLSYLDKKR